MLAACIDGEPELQFGETTANVKCPKWGCGENSPIMGPYVFHELHTGGQMNAELVSVASFQKGDTVYRNIRIVNGGQLVVNDPNSGAQLSGSGLAGGFFNLTTPQGAYKLIIAKVTPKAESDVVFWVGPATQIETYELSYSGPRGTAGRLCQNPPNRASGELAKKWEAPLEAMFYTGDRYNASAKTVTHAAYDTTQGWFNIACAGSALAKLHLNRHTTAGTTVGYATSQLQRQTLLKMYVMDACGDGQNWTVPGEPLHWENSTKTSQLLGTEVSIEAMWGPSGASCLDVHRLGIDYKTAINAICGRPACPPMTPGQPLPFTGNLYIVSANPHVD